MSDARIWQIIAAIAVTALIIISISFTLYRDQDDDDSELVVRFLNIGHGLSILIQTPDGKNVLIDAGSFDTFTSTTVFLEDLNVSRIDAFIITHPHPDHVPSPWTCWRCAMSRASTCRGTWTTLIRRMVGGHERHRCGRCLHNDLTFPGGLSEISMT